MLTAAERTRRGSRVRAHRECDGPSAMGIDERAERAGNRRERSESCCVSRASYKDTWLEVLIHQQKREDMRKSDARLIEINFHTNADLFN